MLVHQQCSLAVCWAQTAKLVVDKVVPFPVSWADLCQIAGTVRRPPHTGFLLNCCVHRDMQGFPEAFQCCLATAQLLASDT